MSANTWSTTSVNISSKGQTSSGGASSEEQALSCMNNNLGASHLLSEPCCCMSWYTRLTQARCAACKVEAVLQCEGPSCGLRVTIARCCMSFWAAPTRTHPWHVIDHWRRERAYHNVHNLSHLLHQATCGDHTAIAIRDNRRAGPCVELIGGPKHSKHILRPLF